MTRYLSQCVSVCECLLRTDIIYITSESLWALYSYSIAIANLHLMYYIVNTFFLSISGLPCTWQLRGAI